MGKDRYKIYDNNFPYFISSSVVSWIPLFKHKFAAEILVKSLKFIQNKENLTIYAYVIMHDHIHLIVKAENLAKSMANFKSYTARKIIDYLKKYQHNEILFLLEKNKPKYKKDRKYQLWQEGIHPKQIIDENMMHQKIEYMHNNPVKNGFVSLPEDWIYLSSRNYSGQTGILEIQTEWF